MPNKQAIPTEGGEYSDRNNDSRQPCPDQKSRGVSNSGLEKTTLQLHLNGRVAMNQLPVRGRRWGGKKRAPQTEAPACAKSQSHKKPSWVWDDQQWWGKFLKGVGIKWWRSSKQRPGHKGPHKATRNTDITPRETASHCCGNSCGQNLLQKDSSGCSVDDDGLATQGKGWKDCRKNSKNNAQHKVPFHTWPQGDSGHNLQFPTDSAVMFCLFTINHKA